MEKFHCSNCNRSFPVTSALWQCSCGSFLDLLFEPRFPIEEILKRPSTLWRYREAIPVLADENIVSLGEGLTPLKAIALDGRAVLVKIDYLFPTGSYKDRGASILVSKAKEFGIRKVVEDSSGNAGAAIAAYCAGAGIRCDIYVPASTSPGKLSQIDAYGAALSRIEGSRETTAKAAMKAASSVYYASHCWNPYFLHGTKTFAYEIWEQMGWRAPEAVILPVGHGTLFLGAWIGFRELKDSGMIRRVPRLIGVQSACCAPVYQAFKRGLPAPRPIEKRETVAEGIAIAEPVRGKQILEAVRETDGEMVTVTEKEISRALREMGRKGYFIEPTSAATVAGIRKYFKGKSRNGTIVSTLTGTGLKSAGKTGPILPGASNPP